MYFEHEGKVFEARGTCGMVVAITDVSGMTPRHITDVPLDEEWMEIAKAALTTHMAIERARKAKPVEKENLDDVADLHLAAA
jgi:hypothetical protein